MVGPVITLEGNRQERRRSLMDRLGRTATSDFIAWFTMHEVDGVQRYSGMQTWGDLHAGSIVSQLEGQATLAHWDPTSPPARDVNHFRAGAQRRLREERDAWDDVYVPAGLQHTRRMLVYDGDRFVAWIGTHRLRDGRDFTPREQSGLERFETALLTAVLAEARMDRPPPPEGANLLLDAGGRIEMACAAGKRWLTASRRQMVSSAARRLDGGGDGAAPFLLDGAVVRVVRLCGDGPSRYLFALSAASPARRSPVSGLTPRQREVAELAGAGATVPDIARILGRSTETVRSHLKAIYRELHVSNRVELAELLRDAPPRT